MDCRPAGAGCPGSAERKQGSGRPADEEPRSVGGHEGHEPALVMPEVLARPEVLDRALRREVEADRSRPRVAVEETGLEASQPLDEPDLQRVVRKTSAGAGGGE